MFIYSQLTFQCLQCSKVKISSWFIKGSDLCVAIPPDGNIPSHKIQKVTRFTGTLPEVMEAANTFWGNRKPLVELSSNQARSFRDALLRNHPC